EEALDPVAQTFGLAVIGGSHLDLSYTSIEVFPGYQGSFLAQPEELAMALDGKARSVHFEQGGDVGAGETCRMRCQLVEVDGLVQLHAFGMDLDDLHSAVPVAKRYSDFFVAEASGAHYGRVEHVGP